MTTVYLGQIEIFAFSFAPKGWALCNGQIMSIAQNQALFALLGVSYGGNGQTTFALPDLRGRVPLGVSPSYILGMVDGQETETLLTTEMPSHNHSLMADSTTAANSNGGTPGNNTVLGNAVGVITQPSGGFAVQIYSSAAATKTLNPAVIAPSGGTQPHENRMPYLVLNACIALQGVFPSRN
ncbi:phage tail protein [Labrys okinawensis]|uniref:phage tail protein n=1 Tax=Labrys okinawensis TaxID=346911 RepID=UPI0039BD6A60